MTTQSQPAEESNTPKRNRGGRPNKKSEERIEKGKTINCSPNELKRINQIHQVLTAGTTKSFSSFAKEVIFSLEYGGGQVRKREPIPDQLGMLSLELGQIKKELRSIGTLYNQVVKRINSLYVSAEIKQESQQHNHLIAQIEPLMNQVNKLIEQIENVR